MPHSLTSLSEDKLFVTAENIYIYVMVNLQAGTLKRHLHTSKVLDL